MGGLGAAAHARRGRALRRRRGTPRRAQWSSAATFRLGPLDEEIAWGERIAIEGPNGTGKTTLLWTLLGRLPLVAGTRQLGPAVVVGELDQARRQFVGEATLLDTFLADSGLLVQEARSLLAKFGLGPDHVARTATTLSPGERTRAALALLMAKGTNCLVLDEPTNHLDLPAIEQLEAALDEWDGTLLLVTHDRRLREQVRIDRTITLPPCPDSCRFGCVWRGHDPARRTQTGARRGRASGR